MNIYHYSENLYKELLTRRKSRLATEKELRQGDLDYRKYSGVGNYNDHISFFFDPLPLKTICKLYKEKNEFYKKDNEFFEYTINVNSIDFDVNFFVAESPLEMAYRDSIDWTNNSDEFLIAYCETEYKLKRKWGEIGHGLTELKKQIKLYQGKTEDFYIAASKRKDFEEFIKKYAANVPHLMLYPPSGIVKVQSIAKVKAGYNERVPLLPDTQNKTTSVSFLDW